MNDDALINRALAAYFRTEAAPMQPARSDTGVETHDGKVYVVLRNIGGLLAVYRVQNRGQLKRLRRWPKVIDEPV